MTALTTAELILAALLALIVLTLAFIWLRRKVIARGHDLILGAIRTTADPRWRLGLIRLRGDQFEWFSVVGPRMRSERSWARHDLDLGAPTPVDVDIPGIPGAVMVDTGRHQTELALSPPSYTAVRAWHESSPPGFNVNVA
ncbi:MAG TPA: DUF2550 family protein [Phycicoccus elongatus]|jgi:hypothetical protein|nr:DUF2550 family protein [Phycicoccus elongatus]